LAKKYYKNHNIGPWLYRNWRIKRIFEMTLLICRFSKVFLWEGIIFFPGPIFCSWYSFLNIFLLKLVPLSPGIGAMIF
jgi:hypothetical protein